MLLLNLGTPELFLSQCLQPPSVDQVRQSIAVLIELRAVLPVAALPLTALGFHLARMPVDVRIGKMLIYASLLGVSVFVIDRRISFSCSFLIMSVEKGLKVYIVCIACLWSLALYSRHIFITPNCNLVI